MLIAFGALAYGWVGNNDAILYGSIGASILAGLFLLRATMADRKAGYPEPGRPARRDRPERERKPSKKDRSDYPPATSRPRRGEGRGGRLDSDELTRQMDMSSDADDFMNADSEQATSFRPQNRRRELLPEPPPGAAWAQSEDRYDETEFEEEDRGQGVPSYDSESADEEDAAPAAQATQSAAAADDFRSRLAAVLGSTGEPEAAVPPPAPKRARRPAPEPVPLEEPEPLPAAPKRRGRKKASDSIGPPEPELAQDTQEAEPDWVRIDDAPRTSRATQPGGGFARPDSAEGITPYRPRRAGAAADAPAEGEAAPAPRKRRPAAGTEGSVRSVTPKRPAAGGTAGAGRTAPAEKTRAKAAKDRDPDAPPPRRGRPPKPKP